VITGNVDDILILFTHSRKEGYGDLLHPNAQRNHIASEDQYVHVRGVHRVGEMAPKIRMEFAVDITAQLDAHLIHTQKYNKHSHIRKEDEADEASQNLLVVGHFGIFPAQNCLYDIDFTVPLTPVAT
jgi:hypothetical protein